MIEQSTETIVALATPAGRGSVGVVRISGPKATEIAVAVLGEIPLPRHARFLPFLGADNCPIDQGIALFFPGPHSYTGEDVLELQGHGGPMVLDLLLARALALGARVAKPGEFSERAFLNNKMDLLQCEAVAQLIEANSEQAMRAALRSLSGSFSSRVNTIVEALIRLRMYVEAAIDFPEEEIDFLQDAHIAEQLKQIELDLHETLRQAGQGARLQEGIKLVIVGKPNAGKSSLLNQLTQEETAIVTDVPGTTRDLVKANINLQGLPVLVVDTAGLRHSDDVIEQEGIRRAGTEIASADVVMVIVDGCVEHTLNPFVLFPDWLRSVSANVPIILVKNKIDLMQESPVIQKMENYSIVSVSASLGLGVSLLVEHIHRLVGLNPQIETDFLARRRHLDGLQQALFHVENGVRVLETQSGELLAEELRIAQIHLAELTGQVTSDDLLGRIFSEFCIGK